MALKHLTDADIQDYLDGNLSQKQTSNVTQHLDTCNSCKNELSKYKSLYSELRTDTGISLSTNFSKSVISRLQGESTEVFYLRFWDVFLSVIGLVFAVGTTLYFVDFKPLAKPFTDILQPQIDFSILIFTNLKGVLAELNIDINLFVFAGLILLVIIALDHVIYRHKDKLVSFVKTPPSCCHL